MTSYKITAKDFAGTATARRYITGMTEARETAQDMMNRAEVVEVTMIVDGYEINFVRELRSQTEVYAFFTV